jgi:serine/threonine protein kinase
MDMINALYYLQQHEILHNDIKPNNIVYDRREKVHKLIDFGNAKMFRYADFSIGSYYISAPEVLARSIRDDDLGDYLYLKQASIDSRSDMWSLACSVYMWFTNRPLVLFSDSAEKTLDSIDDIFANGGRLLSALLNEIRNENVRNFVRDCIKLNPEDRPFPSQYINHTIIAEKIHPSTDVDETTKAIIDELVDDFSPKNSQFASDFNAPVKNLMYMLAHKTLFDDREYDMEFTMLQCFYLIISFATGDEFMYVQEKYNFEEYHEDHIQSILETVDFYFYLE